MPIGGTRQQTVAGSSYRKDPLYPFAKTFLETASYILNEDGCDIFEEPTKVMRRPSTKETMKRFFVEDSVDTSNGELEPEDIDDEEEMMEEQFENDCHAMFEHATLAEYNPVVGMALPIHKLILMNNVFDKGGIQKVTAVQPKFTISLERRILVTPEGEELDMFLDQNKMTAAIDATNPMKEFELTLPQTEDDNDILAELGGTSLDSLGIDTYISAVKVEGVVIEEGDIKPNDEGYIEKGGEIAEAEETDDVWFRTNIRFTPNYGGPNHFERTVVQPLTISCKQKVDGETKQVEIKEAISGSMNKNKFNIMATYGKITAVKLSAKLDTSNAMLETCQVKWKVDTDLVEIPTNIPINTTISPREVKDLAAMYNVNQLTKLMGMFKNAMSNYKDDHIKMELDTSYKRMDERTSFWGKFDFAPRDGYALDHVEWRHKTFMDYLDGYVTRMLQVLNDPNMTVTIFGDPEIVRKITPKEYSYQAPANIGPVTLDYTQTIVNTSDKRVYNFIGSDKMRGTCELMILLNPRNSERIIYRIYDYQLYISNEIRNIANPALPAIHAYEDWKFVEYQPVQGRIQILNPTGLVEA
jgi:hypothetical protein